MTEDRVPTTEAGRSFLRWMADREHWHPVDGRRDVTTGYVLAIEAEASAAGWNRANDAARAAASEQPAPPLDVERLGRAMSNVMHLKDLGILLPKLVAAEYERLARDD